MLPTNDDESRPTPTRQQREPFMPSLLLTLAAPLLWVLHFAAVYLLEGFLCAPLSSPLLIPGIIFLFTLLCAGACVRVLFAGAAWLGKTAPPLLQSHQFLADSQRLLAGLSLMAIIWTAAGALFLAPCAVGY
jgi:hypothetical protein